MRASLRSAPWSSREICAVAAGYLAIASLFALGPAAPCAEPAYEIAASLLAVALLLAAACVAPGDDVT